MTPGQRDFQRILPRLVAAYRRGRLVPFTGGGLSAPVCASWSALVAGLEREAAIAEPALSELTPSQELIRRANRAVRRLRAASPAAFPSAVRRALRPESAEPIEPPLQTRALARPWWPLVISTNYDDLFLSAFLAVHGPGRLEVVGRSASDCQRVLDALYSPASALLWTLQGFLGGIRNGTARETEHALAHELVVGHEEYRRVTYREPHFRRAFGEVFRARSFLFVGSGLKDVYVLELLGEVLELLGASANPNFAIVKRGEVDPDFLHARFETLVVEYDDHAEVPDFLNTLVEAVDRESARIVRWSFSLTPPVAPLDASADPPATEDSLRPEVEIVRGRLPRPLPGECAAVSVGGAGTMAFLGRGGRAFLFEMGVPQKGSLDVRWPEEGTTGKRAFAVAYRRHSPPDRANQSSWLVARVPDVPVYLVRARTEEDEYSLGLIADAFEELLRAAVRDGFSVLHTVLIASGGNETRIATGRADYHQRPYPAYYSLIQMIRAYARWRRGGDANGLRIVIYVVDRSVAFELESGRLDITDLLGTDTNLNFWTEARMKGGGLDRRLFGVPETTTLGVIADALDLPQEGWLVDVVPLPRLGGAVLHRIEEAHDRTLADLDVVAGATLRFQPIGG